MSVLYYECKKCSTIIEPNTSKKLKFCKCGKIGIDGTFVNSRVVGDKKFLLTITEEKEEIVYRIKNLRTGLYYNPYKYPRRAHFSTTGKIYTRRPCVNWGEDVGEGECVIEKYMLQKSLENR